MKSLQLIKAQYAEERRFNSWEHFCLVANDDMFVRAIDEIADLFAKFRVQEIFNSEFTKQFKPAVTKRYRLSKRLISVNSGK